MAYGYGKKKPDTKQGGYVMNSFEPAKPMHSKQTYVPPSTDYDTGYDALGGNTSGTHAGMGNDQGGYRSELEQHGGNSAQGVGAGMGMDQGGYRSEHDQAHGMTQHSSAAGAPSMRTAYDMVYEALGEHTGGTHAGMGMGQGGYRDEFTRQEGNSRQGLHGGMGNDQGGYDGRYEAHGGPLMQSPSMQVPMKTAHVDTYDPANTQTFRPRPMSYTKPDGTHQPPPQDMRYDREHPRFGRMPTLGGKNKGFRGEGTSYSGGIRAQRRVKKDLMAQVVQDMRYDKEHVQGRDQFDMASENRPIPQQADDDWRYYPGGDRRARVEVDNNVAHQGGTTFHTDSHAGDLFAAALEHDKNRMYWSRSEPRALKADGSLGAEYLGKLSQGRGGDARAAALELKLQRIRGQVGDRGHARG